MTFDLTGTINPEWLRGAEDHWRAEMAAARARTAAALPLFEEAQTKLLAAKAKSPGRARLSVRYQDADGTMRVLEDRREKPRALISPALQTFLRENVAPTLTALDDRGREGLAADWGIGEHHVKKHGAGALRGFLLSCGGSEPPYATAWTKFRGLVRHAFGKQMSAALVRETQA